ncbi:MAG: potassium channel protein [Patescibacteria group bacterium]
MGEKEPNKKPNLGSLLFLILALVAIGVIGYMTIEGWSFLDALYMVVITLATVGFKEVHAMSPAGTIFTILLIIFGLITLYYVVRLLSEYILENKLEETLKYKKMEKTLRNLSGHYIICGFGRVGHQVVHELSHDSAEFVVIERNPKAIEACERLGYPCINGDATDEDALKQAGILNAKGLILCLGEDSDTVLTVVTARSMSKDIFIVARASGENTAGKLLKIGANRVVSPHQIGGFRMANFAINPEVADFIDDIQDLSNTEVQIDDVVVPLDSPAAGHTIAERLSNRTYGVTILAIHKQDGEAIINPTGDVGVEGGDRLILLGTKGKLDAMVKLLGTHTR